MLLNILQYIFLSSPSSTDCNLDFTGVKLPLFSLWHIYAAQPTAYPAKFDLMMHQFSYKSVNVDQNLYPLLVHVHSKYSNKLGLSFAKLSSS